jgi:hypothetical protein
MNKDEFLEKAMQANQDAISQSKLSDMVKGDSSFYIDPNAQPIAPTPIVKKIEDPDALPQIRTFSADINTAVDSNSLSVSHIVNSETKRKREEQLNNEPKKKKSLIFFVSIVLACMLMIGGIGAIGYVFVYKNKQADVTNTPVVYQQDIIRADHEIKLEIKNPSARTIADHIKKELKNPPQTDGIRKISFVYVDDLTETRINLKDLFGFLEISIPENLSRFLLEDYVLGINFIKGEGKIVLILKGDNFEQIFPGMLEWESTMADDLKKIFVKNELTTKLFSDAIIANKDTRVLLTANNQIGFFYSIINDVFIVFTEDESSFLEIIKRVRESTKK